jgi:hypothetical protein
VRASRLYKYVEYDDNLFMKYDTIVYFAAMSGGEQMKVQPLLLARARFLHHVCVARSLRWSRAENVGRQPHGIPQVRWRHHLLHLHAHEGTPLLHLVLSFFAILYQS